MNTLRLSLKTKPYLSNLFTSFYKKKSNNESFIKGFLSIILVLQSYCYKVCIHIVWAQYFKSGASSKRFINNIELLFDLNLHKVQ